MSDNISVRLHGRAELKSRIEPRDDPTMVIEWLKDDVPVRSSGRVNTFFNRGYAALIITGFEDEDSGRYSCIATNSFGTDRVEASLRLDTRYRTHDYEARSREEQVKRLRRIAESMRLADQIEQERKAEREMRLKRESEEGARQRRLADIARRDERIEQARQRAAEAKQRAEALQKEIQEQKKLSRSREELEAARTAASSSSTRSQKIIHDTSDGFIGEEDNFRYYIKRPYRELEDSIIFRREREIYETVREFEPLRKKQVSGLEEERSKELEKIENRVRRLRGGDSISTVKSDPTTSSKRDMDEVTQDSKTSSLGATSMQESFVVAADQNITTKNREQSDESDGFQEDSFIYTDLKVSESPTLDIEILNDREKLKSSLNQRNSRRKVVFAEEESETPGDSIKKQYEGKLNKSRLACMLTNTNLMELFQRIHFSCTLVLEVCFLYQPLFMNLCKPANKLESWTKLSD